MTEYDSVKFLSFYYIHNNTDKDLLVLNLIKHAKLLKKLKFMTFRYVDDILGFFPDIRVLERNSQPYSLLLYQHEGKLFANTQRIGNINTDENAVKQLNSFFALAKEKNVDLALTPEYSCPWTVIESIISFQDKWPSEKKLWVVGAESITKEEIISFHQQYNTHNRFIYFDESLLQDNKTFFDPLIYFFVSNSGGNFRLNLFIQFKTHHMSVWSGGEVERNNLIQGRELYILRNSNDSINFLSFICSEAMNVPEKINDDIQMNIGWLDRPYLIFNPQLNSNPAHNQFTSFRKFIMMRHHKEIIELNWNMNSKIGEENLIPGGSSRSGFFINSSDITESGYNKIRRNHARGLYYFSFGKNKHAFVCNSYVNAFLINSPAVDISGVVQQQSRRDGPITIETYSFNDEKNLVTSPSPPSDKSITYLGELSCDNPFFTNPANCIIEKERLACISSGEIAKGTSEWYSLKDLYSIKMDANTEINLRITIAEDTIQQSTDQRRKYVRAINELDYILSKRKDLFPPSIAALISKNLEIGYYQLENDKHEKIISLNKFKYNLTTLEGELIIATVCFLDHPADDEVKSKFDILQSIFDYHDSHKGRVVIFYKRGADYFVKYDSNAGKFTIGNDYSGPSYLNVNL